MIDRTLSHAVSCVMACLVLAACADTSESESIDVQVFTARLDEDPAVPPPTGWRRVEFTGSHRSRPGTFLVSVESILTGWSITAFRSAEEPDGSRSINSRLNAAAKKRLAEFCADEANLKLPLALRIDGRWADFSPLLRAPGDRLSLYGFTAEEATRLKQWLEVR